MWWRIVLVDLVVVALLYAKVSFTLWEVNVLLWPVVDRAVFAALCYITVLLITLVLSSTPTNLED